MPMMRNGKVTGVLNNGDASNNEMSYVDMHDLHPENVQAAMINGALGGAVSGATLTAMPVGVVAICADLLSMGTDVADLASTSARSSGSKLLTPKTLGIGAAAVAIGAVVMGLVRGYTAKKEAETHNAWSDRVLSRMQARDEQAARHAGAITNERDEARDSGTQIG